MTEKSDAAFKRAGDMIREIKDPAELQRQLREMIDTEFPVRGAPFFQDGERMAMHEFLSRYQLLYCRGVVPAFYQRQIKIISESDGRVYLMIDADSGNAPFKSSTVQGSTSETGTGGGAAA